MKYFIMKIINQKQLDLIFKKVNLAKFERDMPVSLSNGKVYLYSHPYPFKEEPVEFVFIRISRYRKASVILKQSCDINNPVELKWDDILNEDYMIKEFGVKILT